MYPSGIVRHDLKFNCTNVCITIVYDKYVLLVDRVGGLAFRNGPGKQRPRGPLNYYNNY